MYKRQDYIIKKGDEASLREQIAFAMTGIEHYIIPAFDKAVSYTHRDVYKRQLIILFRFSKI